MRLSMTKLWPSRPSGLVLCLSRWQASLLLTEARSCFSDRPGLLTHAAPAELWAQPQPGGVARHRDGSMCQGQGQGQCLIKWHTCSLHLALQEVCTKTLQEAGSSKAPTLGPPLALRELSSRRLMLCTPSPDCVHRQGLRAAGGEIGWLSEHHHTQRGASFHAGAGRDWTGEPKHCVDVSYVSDMDFTVQASALLGLTGRCSLGLPMLPDV